MAGANETTVRLTRQISPGLHEFETVFTPGSWIKRTLFIWCTRKKKFNQWSVHLDDTYLAAVFSKKFLLLTNILIVKASKALFGLVIR